jgi:5'-3' exonuclease
MALVTSLYKDGYIIVDTSYVIHTIASRALKIYGGYYDLPEDPEELYDIIFTDDDDFRAIYDRNFISTIKKFLNKSKVHKSRTVFALDCPKRDIWRRDYFDAYKLGRMTKQKEKKGPNLGPIFEYTKTQLIPSMVSKGFGCTLEHPLAEGDDVIAIFVKMVREVSPRSHITLVCHDRDFLQLLDQDEDNLDMFNVQEKDLKSWSIGTRKENLLLKILVGDNSDEIPKCFDKVRGDKILSRGFGAKAAMKLVEDEELLKEMLKKYPEAVKKFMRNKKLIDFN